MDLPIPTHLKDMLMNFLKYGKVMSNEFGEVFYMLKVIVFDFDYTLGDSTNGIVLSINYALEQLGHTTKNIDEIKKTIGLSLKETYFSLTGSNDSKETEQFVNFFKDKADDVMVENTILYAGVIVDAKTAENAKVKFAAVLTGTTSSTEFGSYSNVYIGKNVTDVCNNVLALE